MLPKAVSHRGLLQHSGDFVTGDLVGAPYLVCRDEEGRLRAFHNVRYGSNYSLRALVLNPVKDLLAGPARARSGVECHPGSSENSRAFGLTP